MTSLIKYIQYKNKNLIFMENINLIRERVKVSGLSKNAKTLVYEVLESSNYSSQGVERRALLQNLNAKWTSYIEAQETIQENLASKAYYEKRLKWSRRTLGLIKKPTPPQLKPVKEFPATPVPCNENFRKICFEVFQSGLIETKTVNGQEHICPTAKLIQP